MIVCCQSSKAVLSPMHSLTRPYKLVSRTHRIRAPGLLSAVDSFCTAGAPLKPDRPDNFSSTLIGNPPPKPPHAKVWGCPPKSDGSVDKVEKVCVETPNRAVYALFSAISMQRIGARPSAEALRFPVIENRYVLADTNFSGFRHAASTFSC